MQNPYTESFYRTYADESRRSASVIVPLICQLVRPEQVIDVGCGIGTWLREFMEQGVPHVTGVDGVYVDRTSLLFPAENFVAHDLSRPFSLGKRYDLAISLEVAEHIPAEYASQFVETLTGLAPVVFFSAAIPHQGGDGHLNEQWPEYWIERFAMQGYRVIDCIRDKVWENESVAYYYAQNSFLFAHADTLPLSSVLAQESRLARSSCFSRVHPRKWLEANDPSRQRLPWLLKSVPISAWNALTLRFGRIFRPLPDKWQHG